ncbi:ankyrin repeat-containing domain protein [Lophiotrema nucula]|uniref:Ankyrin repeat-containing domain protein n=1 Tax=Lophiotrema nucula TaxID=690887 RepID=A0A6A5YRY5_9PLEO|nr:ankyrin repeat-containing domain protein [Lophiotrema nucula]
MPKSVVSDSGKRAPNLWKEAYKALSEDEKGKERLRKLNVIIKEQLGKPNLKLRSDDGYKQLLTLIDMKAKELKASKASEKVGKICDNMLRIQDLVSAGVNVGGPYVAIPASALFLAFSMNQIYRSEKEALFKLAENIAHFAVLSAKSHERIKASRGDDADMRELKNRLHMVYIGLYKGMLLASAQLVISLYGTWQLLKNLAGHYDWEGQLSELNEKYNLCVQYRDEMLAWQLMHSKKKPDAPKKDMKKAMGPGPRNSLHWAVALTVPEQVSHFVKEKEYPINALTPRRWTAAHLAAREGNLRILKTLLTVEEIDLHIKNTEGRTPLHLAALHNRVGAVKLLLQRNHKLIYRRDNRGKTSFLLAAKNGHADVLKVLKESGQDMNESTLRHGWTGLHLAADNEHVKAVKYLVANGTSKGAKIKDGPSKRCTAKQIAEKKGNLKVLEYL